MLRLWTLDFQRVKEEDHPKKKTLVKEKYIRENKINIPECHGLVLYLQLLYKIITFDIFNRATNE